MKTRIFAGIVCLSVLIGLTFSGSAQAEDKKAAKPSMEDQLSQIIQSQKMIEQRLANLEVKQSTIINAFGAFGSALRPGQGGMAAGGGCGGGMAAGGGCGGGMAAGGGGGCGGGGAAGGPPPEDFSKVYNIPLGNSLLKGDKKAKATIVEFSDFQCPFSRRFHPVVAEVMKAYPNDVNYILKNLPLSMHPNARPAAKASLAAREQGKYWEMTEALFQSELGDAKYEEIAKQIGLDVEKFKKDLKDKDAEYEKAIQEDLTTAGSVAAQGTPTFYLNGKKTSARDMASFKTEIDKILQGKK